MKERHIFSIYECPDGYEIADNVFDRYGSLVVSKNTIVNEYIRQKLKNLRKYLKGVNSAKVIINDLSAGRVLDYEKVKNVVLMHHEKETGTGYPYGMRSEGVSYFAKIISIADVFDTLTSERVYKNRLTPFDTFREFERVGSGEGHYDLSILLTFLYNISQYYIGSRVMMSMGKVGEIIYIPPHNISRPVVRNEDDYIDLSVRQVMSVTTYRRLDVLQGNQA